MSTTTDTRGHPAPRTNHHSGPDAPVRASDTERADTVARLQQALGEGRLDLAETDERVATAYAARYRSDLPPLLADLPAVAGGPLSAPSEAPDWSTIWTAVVWRIRLAVLGTVGSGGVPPTPRDRRIAAVLVAGAAVWMLVCAFLGAAVVGP